MRQVFQASFFFIVLGTGVIPGCRQEERAPAPKSPNPTTDRGHRWGEPYDWRNNPPAIREVDFSAIAIDDLNLRETVIRWEAAASNQQDEGWFHHGWYAHPGKRHGAVQWWSSTPEHVSPDGSIEGGAQSKLGSVQNIRLECVSNTSMLKPEFTSLTADWMPEEKGWGAHLYASSRGPNDGQVILMFHPRGIGNAEQTFNFFPGMARWEHRDTFDGVNYHFRVSLPEGAFSGGAISAALRFDRLSQWSLTADSFRSAGLKMLNQLEQEIRTQVSRGTATRRVSVTIVEGGTESWDSPRSRQQPRERPLEENERHIVIKSALREMSRRRATFEAHFSAMHTAMECVFPMATVSSP